MAYHLSRRQFMGKILGLSLLVGMGGSASPRLAFASGQAEDASIARPLLIGVNDKVLGAEQARGIRFVRPIGIILYRSNIQDRVQLKAYTSALREAAGKDLLIMIDSEGGKIVRLKPPHWRLYPGASDLGLIASRNEEDGKRATYLTYRLMAHALDECGINTNIAPVLDLRHREDMVHSDYRSFGRNPQQVATLARIACLATLEGGVLPVIKHMPGQGRVDVNTDIHNAHITASAAELEEDFSVFRALNDMPLAMGSNVVFDAVDSAHPACMSAAMTRLIREKIGFKGMLMTDDLGAPSMLVGDRANTLRSAEAAGNDILQYTFGILNPALGKPYLPERNRKTQQFVSNALAKAKASFKPCDAQALQEELDMLLARYNITVS